MKTKIVTIFFSLFPFLLVAHDNRNITIFGRLIDSFTYELLHPAKMDILTVDSTIVLENIDSYDVLEYMGKAINFAVEIGREHKKLILRFQADKYETGYTNITLPENKRVKSFYFDDVMLHKEAVILDEIKVVASKVKMVIRGDTIVYNADAFQLSKGSMLDGLVRSLPGVAIDGGRITVNGRFISSLLLNGEGFFNGDPKVALDNLPAYTVDKIKVYEKSPEYDFITGRNHIESLPLVMDVNLKQHYNVGWIANAETGLGTHSRWLARLFGLRFTDNSRLTIFSNLNNINDTKDPGISGNWNSGWPTEGLCNMRYGGMDLLLKDKTDTWKLNSNVKGLLEDTDYASKSSTINFLESSNSYHRGCDISRMKRAKLISNHNFELKLKKSFIKINAFTEYADGYTDIYKQNAEFNKEPLELYRCAILDTLFRRSLKLPWQSERTC